MKHLTILLAALMGAVVSTPAQSLRSSHGREPAAVTVRPASGASHRRGPSTSRYQPARRVSVSRAAPSRTRSVSGRVSEVRSAARVGFGRWVTRCEQVLVPGYWDRHYVPAVHGWVLNVCGVRVWGVVSPAGYRDVWVPARYDTQRRRVWVRY